ncbi:MAG: hypothetical protein JRH10_17435, partial [Deltaproteobacteria bacterium]|nr:hypothetical protein [Deltaproteobacteria bacterium]
MKRILLTTIALLFAASPAAADELQFGWRSLVEYDSELTTRGGGQDDFIFTNGPVTRLEGAHRKVNYTFEHFTAYEKYVNLTELDGFRHEVRGTLRYQLSPRVRFDFSNSFQSLPTLRDSARGEQDPAIDEGDTRLNIDTGTILSNVLTASMT